MDAFFEFEAVSVAAQDKDGVRRNILEDVSLRVPAKARWAVVGPSGSGKSTLLRLLNRMLDPGSGRVLRDGIPVADISPALLRREIALVSQVPVWLPGTARDNLLASVGLGLLSSEDGASRLPAILDLAGIEPEWLDRGEDELSVGQRQRVALGRALLTRPRALLLDEPTSALDPPGARDLLRQIQVLGDAEGLTMLLVTHRLEDARALAGYTVVLENGRVVDQGDSEPVLARLETRWKDTPSG